MFQMHIISDTVKPHPVQFKVIEMWCWEAAAALWWFRASLSVIAWESGNAESDAHMEYWREHLHSIKRPGSISMMWQMRWLWRQRRRAISCFEPLRAARMLMAHGWSVNRKKSSPWYANPSSMMAQIPGSRFNRISLIFASKSRVACARAWFFCSQHRRWEY